MTAAHAAPPAAPLGVLAVPCLCAVLAFLPVVSPAAWLLGVVPAGLLGFAVTVAAAFRGHRIAAWVAAGVAVLAWSLGVDVVSGTQSGPAARSALLVGGLTVAMTMLWLSRRPALLLLPSTALVACAIALGTPGAALAWVALYAVAAGLTLVLTGPYGAPDLAQRRRALAVAALLLLAGLTTIATAALTAWLLGAAGIGADPTGTPTSIASGTPATSPPPQEAQQPDAPPESASYAPAAGPETGGASGLAETASAAWQDAQRYLLVLAILLLVLLLPILLAALIAWLRARIAWALLGRRLQTGPVPARIAGAWTWARLQVARGGATWPAWASPDVAARTDAVPGLAAGDDLRALARSAADAGYGDDAAQGALTGEDADRAWAAARAVQRASRPRGVRRRWSWACRMPSRAGRALPGAQALMSRIR